MRLTYVVQRYGLQVAGGAEAACRSLAEAMASDGHEVRVLTSTAIDYSTWADELPSGTTNEHGVNVRRLAVTEERNQARFGPLSGRVRSPRANPTVEAEWMLAQGPRLDDFARIVAEEAERCEAMIFMTYLYPTTAVGLPVAGGLVATILHPTAHEEWPFRLHTVGHAVRHADALACFSPEEAALIDHRIQHRGPSAVIPLGATPAPATDPAAFRTRFGLDDDPFVLCLGRIDPNKGTDELLATFLAFRDRLHPNLKLVLMGAEVMEVPRHPGVIVTGFVDDATKWDALAAATVLVQPSRQESFSIVLVEAWQMGLPVVVQEECEVLAGFVRRASGGVAYRTPSELAASLDVLLGSPSTRARLGENGRRHIEAEFSWPVVIDRYEELIDRARTAFDRRRDTAQSTGTRPTTA